MCVTTSNQPSATVVLSTYPGTTSTSKTKSCILYNCTGVLVRRPSTLSQVLVRGTCTCRRHNIPVVQGESTVVEYTLEYCTVHDSFQ